MREWPLGKPDLILEIPAYKIPATGVVDYHYPVVANPLTKGKWLKASTTVVGARQAVHHVLSGFLRDGEVGGADDGVARLVRRRLYGRNGICGQSERHGHMGTRRRRLPVPAALHTFRQGSDDRRKVGLYFYKDGEMPDLIMREMPLVDQFIEIPANDGNHKEIAYFDFPKDAILHTAVVHAHYRGTYSKLELMTPDGARRSSMCRHSLSVYCPGHHHWQTHLLYSF